VCGPQLLQWAVDHLHPTPAVCGVPTAAARALILANEGFTRGLYASCCGAITRRGGELMVGLRSATVHRDRVHVYAGAGLVPGSDAAAEWAEIGLKMGQYLRALRGVSARPALCDGFPTATCALMAVVVEEMLRQGVGTFFVAVDAGCFLYTPVFTHSSSTAIVDYLFAGAFVVCPGSRSTPLAVAIHRHGTARTMTQVRPPGPDAMLPVSCDPFFSSLTRHCHVLVYRLPASHGFGPLLEPCLEQVVHDERSAGFYALGCARAGVLCAVVVTSGTAVSNLLPALSEAREAGLAMLLLTADRPAESRDVGEYQTIKQARCPSFPSTTSCCAGLHASHHAVFTCPTNGLPMYRWACSPACSGGSAPSPQ
jgi:hypothetical protein